MSAIPHFTCKHGRHDGEPCDACLIHWSEHCIESARQNIAKHERKIAELRAKSNSPVVPPDAQPGEPVAAEGPTEAATGPLSEPKETT